MTQMGWGHIEDANHEVGAHLAQYIIKNTKRLCWKSPQMVSWLVNGVFGHKIYKERFIWVIQNLWQGHIAKDWVQGT